MSNLAALMSLLFLLLAGFVVAQVQVSAPACPAGNLGSWEWTFNTLGQNACTVAAYLLSTCNGGWYSMNPLQPGYGYTGPTGATAVNVSNICKCNTVTYSLLSACDACQGIYWFSWYYFSTNCTQTMPPSTFPNPVPAGTRVPQWALLDIFSDQNNWDANKAQLKGDAPEVGPGGVIGPSGVSSAASTTGTATKSTSTGAASGASTNGSSSSSNAGAIAGGVVGGIAVVSIASVAVFYLRRRRRQRASTPLTTQFQIDQVQHPLPSSDNGTFAPSSDPELPIAPLRFHPEGPHDPTMFPGYQAGPPAVPPKMVPVQQPRPFSDIGTFESSPAPTIPIAPIPMRLNDQIDPNTFPGRQTIQPVSPPPRYHSSFSESENTMTTLRLPGSGYHDLPTS